MPTFSHNVTGLIFSTISSKPNLDEPKKFCSRIKSRGSLQRQGQMGRRRGAKALAILIIVAKKKKMVRVKKIN